MNIRPYKQTLYKDLKIRIFSPLLEESDLKWHRDKNNRYIRIISGTGWQIQVENKLPTDLIKGKTYFINSKNWHRLIKGNNKLIIAIKEI